MKTVAVLMTCHNRVDKTLKCLSALFKQSVCESIKLDVFLVDDGSTGGTGRIVQKEYPEAHVVYGDGNLFWNRESIGLSVKR